MVLPYLTPNVIPPVRFADIGMSSDNYFNPDILNSIHALNGKGYTREELKPIYDAGNSALKNSSLYGASTAAQQIIDANPNVRTFSGETGNELLIAANKAPEVGGSHGRLLSPLPNQLPYITLVRDDLDNLQALQTLNHETGHYRMGHSTDYNSVAMPEEINGRNNTNKALKEIEAESVAASLMNRLGYGYAPGVVDRSSAYIGNWYNFLPPQLQNPEVSQKVSERANQIATQLVPEPIRRFGPISTRMAEITF